MTGKDPFHRFSPIIRDRIYTFLAALKAEEISKLIVKETKGGGWIYHNFVLQPTRKCCMCWEVPKGYVVWMNVPGWTIRYFCQGCLNRHYRDDKYALANEIRFERRNTGAVITDGQFGDPENDPYFSRIEFVRCHRCHSYCHPDILYPEGCLQSRCLIDLDRDRYNHYYNLCRAEKTPV